MNKMTTDDIFGDLGFHPAEAAILNRKSELMIELLKIVQTRRLSDAQAAKEFGVARQSIKQLKKGALDDFQIEQLIAMLARVGTSVKFVLSEKKGIRAA